MMSHELQRTDGAIIAALTASTKAGLLTSAIQAVAEAMKPTPGPEKEVERAFAVEAEDFRGLLEAFVQAAIDTGIERKETYDGVRFTLVTATKAQGEFLGRPVESRGAHLTTAQVREDATKGDDGAWTVALELSVG